jgi:hypothetical protein
MWKLWYGPARRGRSLRAGELILPHADGGLSVVDPLVVARTRTLQRAQTGENSPFPGATARCHQGSAVVLSVLKLLGASSGNPARICCRCIT